MSRACGFLTAVSTILCVAGHCSAWGGKEHVQMTRIAAARLIADPSTPAAMKDWLVSIVPQLLDNAAEREYLLTAKVQTNLQNSGGGVLYWVMEPDDRANNDPRNLTRPPFDRHERLMHYIDLELFLIGEKQRRFRDDLSAKPPMENIRRDWRDERYIQAGYLPFATEHAFDQLVKAIKENRLKPTDGVGRRDDDSAMRWAGYLAHYAQDNTQPHHSTLDYKSQTYFTNTRRAPNTHAEFEWRLVDDEKNDFRALREQYWTLFSTALEQRGDPVKSDDPWLATLEVCMISYDALPLIGRSAAAALVESKDGAPAAIDTEKFFAYRDQFRGEEMSVLELKARQTAWAVRRTQRLWLAAWNKASN